ncbi:MAG: hypothetical protein QOJ82_3142 [Solirubrobacteraceae bacterium]|jgi:uncharacterized integral membrane protein|nr:hypothetical protein [Solirubrobacteraceae bacterium]
MSTPETPPAPPTSTSPPPPPPRKERALVSKSIAALAVALLLAAFGVSNDNNVPVDWLLGTTQTPLIVVILVSAALGVVLGLFGAWRRSR